MNYTLQVLDKVLFTILVKYTKVLLMGIMNFIMVVFEVKLFFTNIALQEIIDFCVQKLFKDKKCLDDLSKDSFCKMLTVTKTESIISFDNEYHRKHD